MSLCVPRDQPEKEREGEGERERESQHGGGQACAKIPITLFSKGAIYPKFYIMEDAESCRGSSPDPYRYQAFFLHIFLYTKGLR